MHRETESSFPQNSLMGVPHSPQPRSLFSPPVLQRNTVLMQHGPSSKVVMLDTLLPFWERSDPHRIPYGYTRWNLCEGSNKTMVSSWPSRHAATTPLGPRTHVLQAGHCLVVTTLVDTKSFSTAWTFNQHWRQSTVGMAYLLEKNICQMMWCS